MLGRLSAGLVLAAVLVGCGGTGSGQTVSPTETSAVETVPDATTSTTIAATTEQPGAGDSSPTSGAADGDVITEEELAELERALDEIDQLLADLELELEAD